MFLKKYIVPAASGLLLLLSHAAAAQADSALYHLKPVQVTASRLEPFSTGNRVTKIDSAALQATALEPVTELLRRQVPVFLKTSGAGNLATISFRGTTAEQTALFWNGIQINSPNLGLVDLYLVPVAAVQGVKVVHGPGSALYGSGAVGGAIYLENKPSDRNNIQLSQQLGSFGRRHTSLGATYGNSRWQGRSQVSVQSAENNFTFTNTFKAGKPTERQQHAQLKQHAAFQDFYFSLKENLQLSVHGWWQQTERQLPAPLGVPLSKAEQTDDLLRLAAVLRLRQHFGQLTVRTGYLYDYNRYFDPKLPQLVIDSKATTQTFLAEAEQQVDLRRLQLNIGANMKQVVADLKEYRKYVKQPQGAIFSSAKYTFSPAFLATLNLRKELVPGYKPDLTPSVSTELSLLPERTLVWKVLAAKSYRVPTLNERYWQPGGNPNLKPEQSSSAETGLKAAKTFSEKMKAEAEVTAFTSVIENMIVWRPLPFSTLWGVKNLHEVWARGAEASFKTDLELNKAQQLRLRLQGSYAYTRSTIRKTSEAESANLDKQLIYVPQHNAQASAGLTFRSFGFEWHQTLTDSVFTTADNTSGLPGYSIADATVQYRQELRKLGVLVLRATVHNLFDERYQAVQNIPMPGRHFDLTLQLNLFTSKY